MPQVLKEEVKLRVVRAASEVFARDGYAGARMAEIARRAGVSTGNIYRYYESRDELFYAVVDESFVRRLRALVRRRVESLDGVADVRELGPDAPYHLRAEELLAFSIRHRLPVVIVLGHAQGSRYEGFAETMAKDLAKLAMDHFRGLEPGLTVTAAMRFNLMQIYRGFLRALVTILESSNREARIRELVAGFTRYHLAGLNGFFEDWSASPSEPRERRRT